MGSIHCYASYVRKKRGHRAQRGVGGLDERVRRGHSRRVDSDPHRDGVPGALGGAASRPRAGAGSRSGFSRCRRYSTTGGGSRRSPGRCGSGCSSSPESPRRWRWASRSWRSSRMNSGARRRSAALVFGLRDARPRHLLRVALSGRSLRRVRLLDGNVLSGGIRARRNVHLRLDFRDERGWEEITRGADMKVPRVFRFVIQYVTPTFILVIFRGAGQTGRRLGAAVRVADLGSRLASSRPTASSGRYSTPVDEYSWFDEAGKGNEECSYQDLRSGTTRRWSSAGCAWLVWNSLAKKARGARRRGMTRARRGSCSVVTWWVIVIFFTARSSSGGWSRNRPRARAGRPGGRDESRQFVPVLETGGVLDPGVHIDAKRPDTPDGVCDVLAGSGLPRGSPAAGSPRRSARSATSRGCAPCRRAGRRSRVDDQRVGPDGDGSRPGERGLAVDVNDPDDPGAAERLAKGRGLRCGKLPMKLNGVASRARTRRATSTAEVRWVTRTRRVDAGTASTSPGPARPPVRRRSGSRVRQEAERIGAGIDRRASVGAIPDAADLHEDAHPERTPIRPRGRAIRSHPSATRNARQG